MKAFSKSHSSYSPVPSILAYLLFQMCYTRVFYAGCDTIVVRKQIWPFENADCYCPNIQQLSPRPGVCRRFVSFARPQLDTYVSNPEQQDTISNEGPEGIKDPSEYTHGTNAEANDVDRPTSSHSSSSSSPVFSAAFQAYIDRLRRQSHTSEDMTTPKSKTESTSDADFYSIGLDKGVQEDRWQVLHLSHEDDADNKIPTSNIPSSDGWVSISEASYSEDEEKQQTKEEKEKKKQYYSNDSCSRSDFDSTSDWVVFDFVNTQSCDELAML